MEPDDSSPGLWQPKLAACSETNEFIARPPKLFHSRPFLIASRNIIAKSEYSLHHVCPSGSLNVRHSIHLHRTNWHIMGAFLCWNLMRKFFWKSKSSNSLHDQISTILSLTMIRLSIWKGLRPLWGTSKAQKSFFWESVLWEVQNVKKDPNIAKKYMIDCELRASTFNVHGLEISQFKIYLFFFFFKWATPYVWSAIYCISAVVTQRIQSDVLLHLITQATCFGRYPTIIRPIRNSNVKVYLTSFFSMVSHCLH